MDTPQFNGTFWITMAGIILTFLGSLSVFCLKSKCKNCSICFGLIKIKRDIQAENDEEKMELEHNINYTQSNIR